MLDATVANWIIAITCPLCGVLLFRILNRIEKKLESHDVRITKSELDIAIGKEVHKNNNKELIAEVFAKFEALKIIR